MTTTGAIGSSASRKVADFSRVTSFVSDLQSISKQVSLSLSPILFNVNYSWGLNYTLQSVRDQQRGFTANTAADPNLKEWARASSDSRHQIQGNFRYTFHNAVTLSTSARLSSGTPFTPLVSGDINGDGQSNDRAFIFNPATLNVSDPNQAALKTGIENVLATSPAKDCLTSQMGMVAGRNTCQAPWFFNINSMNVSFVSTAMHLPQRATFRIGVTNFLTGVDLLAHGGNNLHGWGQQPQLDPALLFVRGFDPATNTFKYDVNPRFGNSRLADDGAKRSVPPHARRGLRRRPGARTAAAQPHAAHRPPRRHHAAEDERAAALRPLPEFHPEPVRPDPPPDGYAPADDGPGGQPRVAQPASSADSATRRGARSPSTSPRCRTTTTSAKRGTR